MRSSYKFLVIVLALVVSGIGIAYVLSPRFETMQVGSITIRVDHNTGETLMLDPDKGWIPIPDSPPPYKYGYKYVRDSTPITASPAQP